jgi:hypothetical protein
VACANVPQTEKGCTVIDEPIKTEQRLVNQRLIYIRERRKEIKAEDDRLRTEFSQLRSKMAEIRAKKGV